MVLRSNATAKEVPAPPYQSKGVVSKKSPKQEERIEEKPTESEKREQMEPLRKEALFNDDFAILLSFLWKS